jgi:hypothetical protein
VNNGGERREGGKWVDIFTVGPRVEVGRHRSDRWRAPVRPVSPYRFFWPSLGRTDDFDKFNREALSVEPTYPRKFRSFSSFFEILLLKSSPNNFASTWVAERWLSDFKGTTGQTGDAHQSDRCSLE